MIPDDLASGHKAGYTFAIGKCVKTTINNVDQVNSYEITAVPTRLGTRATGATALTRTAKFASTRRAELTAPNSCSKSRR